MRIKPICLFLLTLFAGCVTYPDVKEIKTIGYSDDVSKGKSTGQFSADDCVWQVFGYWLGGNPDVSRAIANARTQKKSNIGDAFGAGTEATTGGQSIRYANNITTKYTGFNAYIVGKSCVEVSGMGYL